MTAFVDLDNVNNLKILIRYNAIACYCSEFGASVDEIVQRAAAAYDENTLSKVVGYTSGLEKYF